VEEFELLEREEEFRDEVDPTLEYDLKAARALVEMLPVGDGEGSGEDNCCWRCFLFAKNLALRLSVKLSCSAIIGVKVKYYANEASIVVNKSQ
jgi:hypothetical protein